jgi:Ni/Co efflux regulator RcnB
MKSLVIISIIALAVFSSCMTQKMGTSTYTDDVYANPKEDRIEEAKIAAEKKQKQEAINKRYNDSIAAVKQAQKEKDDANPYYKDREFKYDDYYDYEYATRVKRFNNNINGLSYYDNYYTNSYFYSQNPYNYGVSVYNGYSWWGTNYNNYSYNPSVNFYNSWGWGYGNQFNNCYNGYNPYMAGYAAGYNNGFHNGMYGNYYGYGNSYGGYGNSFGFGNYYGYGYGNPYGYGFNSPYNNGWGYYNAYDNNSSYTYGPRTAHGGGNSHRTSNPGLAGGRNESEKYISSMADQQSHAIKFDDIKTPRGNENTDPIRVNNMGTPVGTGGVKPVRNISETTEPVRNPIRNDNNVPVKETTTPIRGGVNQPVTEPVRNNPVKNTEPIRNPVETPVRQNPVKNTEPVKQRIETPRFEAPVRQTPNSPSNNGGGSTPSKNSGGHRPR